ncbi:class F sortase [uncultured Nocardioides sp.]|uniref:class F sortase n=1 Tax=uncultured Nocardioides sp. TaxID=198441 RepID=UPI00261DACB6|nr:class F sortase [uncultured Nocardioides sp.]
MRARAAGEFALALALVGSALVVGYRLGAPDGAPLPERPFALPADRVRDPPPRAPDERPDVDDALVIPSLDVAAPLDLAAVVDGRLALPDDVARAALWEGSAPLRSRRGALLVAGHLDDVDRDHGALFPLSTISPGAAIEVVRGGQVSQWKVVGLTSIPKAALPAEVWRGRGGERRLYVVTCGGPVVAGHYRDNVLVTAAPVHATGP